MPRSRSPVDHNRWSESSLSVGSMNNIVELASQEDRPRLQDDDDPNYAESVWMMRTYTQNVSFHVPQSNLPIAPEETGNRHETLVEDSLTCTEYQRPTSAYTPPTVYPPTLPGWYYSNPNTPLVEWPLITSCNSPTPPGPPTPPRMTLPHFFQAPIPHTLSEYASCYGSQIPNSLDTPTFANPPTLPNTPTHSSPPTRPNTPPIGLTLSQFGTVSSLNTDGSFFLEGNLHPPDPTSNENFDVTMIDSDDQEEESESEETEGGETEREDEDVEDEEDEESEPESEEEM